MSRAHREFNHTKAGVPPRRGISAQTLTVLLGSLLCLRKGVVRLPRGHAFLALGLPVQHLLSCFATASSANRNACLCYLQTSGTPMIQKYKYPQRIKWRNLASILGQHRVFGTSWKIRHYGVRIQFSEWQSPFSYYWKVSLRNVFFFFFLFTYKPIAILWLNYKENLFCHGRTSLQH